MQLIGNFETQQWHSVEGELNIHLKIYLIIPVNFSRTDLGPTHIISAEAILVVTLVTYDNKNEI